MPKKFLSDAMHPIAHACIFQACRTRQSVPPELFYFLLYRVYINAAIIAVASYLDYYCYYYYDYMIIKILFYYDYILIYATAIVRYRRYCRHHDISTAIIFSTIIKLLTSNNSNSRCTTGERSLFASDATMIVVIYIKRAVILLYFIFYRYCSLHVNARFMQRSGN